ncbi:membrane protein insertion efficiency factor YidD [Acetobacteraceae bacterium ESL0709]|nr:membrane protein insertion efficiency factor YidD [Acetobacteraceae bacterium ESL0697]MDF7677742.1 membrane protein insertion efficiency factor YidD [Acetobacteraceae bacterium ESL0709]
MKKSFTGICLFLIRIYQLCISPFIGRNCRFHPTCSAYAVTVISRYGPLRGGWLALKRVLKCHPFHQGGYDPPP